MRRVSRFNEFNNDDEFPDEDRVEELLKDHGWGDGIVGSYRDEFEESPYYKNPKSNEDYADQFHEFMYNLMHGGDHDVWENGEGD